MERSRSLRSTSPARKGAKSPTRKSPTKKSPGRKTPGRQKSKSPSRKANTSPRKSPSRRSSPGRSSSITLEKLPATQLSQIKNSPISARSSVPVEQRVFDLSSVSRSTSLEPQLIKSRIITEESSSAITVGLGDSASILTRRSMRVLSRESTNDLKKEVDANVEKILKANNVPVPTYSDGHYNNSDKYQDFGGETKEREFGGLLGVLLFIMMLPSTAVFLQLACTKNTCVPTKLDRLSFNWKYYLNTEVAALYFGFVVWQMLLSLIPLGNKTRGPSTKYGTLTFRNNGLLSVILTLAVVGILYYYGYPITAYVDKSLQFLSVAYIFGLFLSIILFIKGGLTQYQSPHVDGNKLYDFFMGREINPRFGPFDVKVLLLRVAVIGSIVLNVLMALKSIEGKTLADYSPTLLLIIAFQNIYLLDWYLFEETYLSTFEIEQEAVGYMSAVGYGVWPFIFLLTPKFVYFNRVEAPFYVLAIVAVFYCIGYVIYRASNAQKGNFRKNPSDPNLAYLDTIPTSQGRKLLCGGWWGWVRHPNYLGDIIMNWSLTIACGTSHWLPYFLPVAVTLVLIHRSVRDDSRCKARYGTAWNRYTHKVKYHLIPRIF